MFLAFRPSNGFRYLYLLEGEKKAGEKYSRSKTHLNLGREDELSPKIVAYLKDKRIRKELAKAVVDDFARGDCDALFRKVVMGDWEPASSTVPESEKEMADLPFPLLCYGHLAFRKIWENDLKFKYKIDYLQENKTRIATWSMSNLLFYLCTSRILEPSSYHQAYTCRDKFFYCPWSDIVFDNYYRALDFLHDSMNEIIKYVVKRKHETKNTQIDVAFFDCTKTWFATSCHEKTWMSLKVISETSDEMRKSGKSEDEIDRYLSSEEFAKKLDACHESCERESEEETILRMSDFSNGSSFQPAVTVALAIDQSGFPVDFRILHGNLSRTKTLVSVLDEFRKKHDIQNICFVSEHCHNFSENLFEIQKRKFGYAAVQKIALQTEDEVAEMLEPNGYTNCRFVNGKYVTNGESNHIQQEEFRYKICDRIVPIQAGNQDAPLDNNEKSSRHTKEVQCKVLYTFSTERKKHDIEKLKMQIKCANKETGINSAEIIDKDVIERKLMIAGYAAYLFSIPDETGASAEQMSDEHILSMYHQCQQFAEIESSLQMMGSKFSLMPSNERIYQRSRGHAAVCFIALMLLKSLQQKIYGSGHDMTLGHIVSVLKSALVLPVKTRLRMMLLAVQGGLEIAETGAAGKGMSEAGINDLPESDLEDADTILDNCRKKALDKPSDLALVLEAAGLGTPAAAQSLPELKTTFKMDTLANDLVLSSVMRKRLEAAPTLF